jgi:hypothetical protein
MDLELQLAKPLTVSKTLVLPVDKRITTTKIKFLDRLTARLTYGVQLFLEKIIAANITSVKEAEKYRKSIQTITGLSSGFAQACRDKALWMFKSYRELRRDWQRDIKRLKKLLPVVKNVLPGRVPLKIGNGFESSNTNSTAGSQKCRVFEVKIDKSTAIGGIISTLKLKVHTPIEVDRCFPSTKTCSRCGSIREVGLNERTYCCYDCHLEIDRDLNSSITLENEGLTKLGMVRTEVTPVEIESSTLASLEYLNRIPYIKASSVVESGSLSALA